MTNIMSGEAQRKLTAGTGPVSKATGTLAATTISLFTVTGTVMVTAIWGKVTTSVTVANSYKLQHNPTTGATSDLVAATDIGTVDTPAGSLLSFDGVKTSSIQQGPGSVGTLMRPIILEAGVIESVSAGTDGEITWYLTYVPITDDGSVVAA
jgi:hypothetical protein